MSELPERIRMRKLKILPLFEWAENNQTSVFNPLIITQKLARHSKMSASTFNAMAELYGYTGRELDQ